GQAGAIEQRGDQLATQVFRTAERRVEQRHPLELGDVRLEVFQRLAQRDREQPREPRAVRGRRLRRVVEQLQFDGVARVDQRRIADRRLLAATDPLRQFYQFRQRAER